MRRSGFAVLLMLLLAAGCARPTVQPPPPSPPPITPAPPPAVPPGPQPPAGVEEWLQYLTVEEKVGQLLWFGLPGPELEVEAESLVKAGQAGGFVLFDRQGEDGAAIRRLTDGLQGLAEARERFSPGLFITVDQEGGKVERFGGALTAWPGAMAIGATGSEAYAEQVARAMARELLSIGVNMNLAPDADVNSNPANPVIGTRSFGEDPALVAKFVAATIRGFQAEGLGAVAKHFPGHGDTHQDSHKELPSVDHDLARLEKIELAPFQAAVQADVDAVMVAHVTFPAVEPDGLPSTLSSKVMTGLLKERLGFKGLVVTDAIDTMKAVTDHYGVEQAIVMSVQAGADVILTTESFGRQAELYDALLAAVKDGRIAQKRLDDAVRRNLAAKARLGLVPGLSEPRRPAPAPGAAPAEAHRKLAAQVGAEGLTVVRNGALPLKLAQPDTVLVVSPTPAVDGVLTRSIHDYHGRVLAATVSRAPTSAEVQNVWALAGESAAIVYGVYNIGRVPEQQALVKELIATGKPVILVGLGEPYDLTAVPEVKTYVAAYGDGAPNLQEVGALLFGTAPGKGKLPVSIPDLYPAGHGLTLAP